MQRRILQFLGSLGGNNVHLLKQGVLDGDEIAWDTEKKIVVHLSMPTRRESSLPHVVKLEKNRKLLGEGSSSSSSSSTTTTTTSSSSDEFNIADEVIVVPIFLDSLLPRIVRLAETSNLRVVSVAACEALHVIVQYIIGKSTVRNSSSSSSSSTSYHILLRKIFPALIRLATSSDSVPSQLFNPMVSQVLIS